MSSVPPKNYIASVPFPTEIHLKPIGVVHSPYKERHGTPRQSELRHTPENYIPVQAQIEILPDVVPRIALKDLEGFDRIWLISWLHLNQHWNPLVRPPRGNGSKRGTLATRAPHRPNPIGLSAAKLIAIKENIITVEGIDLLDQTPILDIKPYVTYCDAFPEARSGYVDDMEKQRLQEKDIFGAE